MNVAAVTENVNVSATAALVETTESGTTGQLRSEEVQGRRIATVVISRVPAPVTEDDVTDDG